MKAQILNYKGFEVKYTNKWADIKAKPSKEGLHAVYFYDGDIQYGVRFAVNDMVDKETIPFLVFESIKACYDKIDLDILKIYETTTTNK